MSSLKIGTFLLSLVVLSACGGDDPPPAVPEPPPPPPAAPPPPAVQPAAQPAQQPAQLEIDPDIRRICGITEAQALFAYDSSRVQPGDHPVLDKLAQCFTTGPLAGRTMRLVGHADPRGDEEYNMALGGKRSSSVKDYLVRAGLGEAQAETTSRGEMDATGTDEATWSRDRRVQVVLAD